MRVSVFGPSVEIELRSAAARWKNARHATVPSLEVERLITVAENQRVRDLLLTLAIDKLMDRA